MIDIKFLRENPDAVRENIRKKFQDAKLPLVDEAVRLDAEKRAAQQECEQLKAARNKLSKANGPLYGQLKKADEAQKAELQKQIDENNAKVKADDERRVEAGILFELSYNLTNGHTFIPEKKLIPATAALLNLDSDTVERGLDRLGEQERMVRSDTSMSVSICSTCWNCPMETPKALRTRALATASSMAACAMPSEAAHVNTRPNSSSLNRWRKPPSCPRRRYSGFSSTSSKETEANGTIDWPILLIGTARMPGKSWGMSQNVKGG